MLRDAEGVKICQKKLGEPDEKNGMRICHEPVHFVGHATASAAGMYSGWYHEDPALDLSHHALWDGAL